MQPRATVRWLDLVPETVPVAPHEGLRERKKRLLRQQLSDVATDIFLDQGFDALRIAHVASRCGVSEKTVYNYFPTKESLVLDRWHTTPTLLLEALADRRVSPVDAALGVLEAELASWTTWFSSFSDRRAAATRTRHFIELVETTPSLRAYEHDLLDGLATQVAGVLAARIGMHAYDPEPQVAARALLELWRVEGSSLRRNLETTSTAARVRDHVTRDVQRAAALLRQGLATFDALQPPQRARRSVSSRRSSPRQAR